jgi:ketosteroid isomerase-like protein
MTSRLEIEGLLHELYAARVRGDLKAVCNAFSNSAKFEIAGASHASPIAVIAVGIDEFRPWLALMLKTFRLTDHVILSMLVDGAHAAVHWRARIHSRITGATVLTELIDLVQVENGRIASYTEFFVPRQSG